MNARVQHTSLNFSSWRISTHCLLRVTHVVYSIKFRKKSKHCVFSHYLFSRPPGTFNIYLNRNFGGGYVLGYKISVRDYAGISGVWLNFPGFPGSGIGIWFLKSGIWDWDLGLVLKIWDLGLGFGIHLQKIRDLWSQIADPWVKASMTTSTRKTIPDEEIDEDPSFLKILPQKCSNFSPKRATKKWKKTQRPDVLDLLDKKAKNLTTQTVKRHTWPWLVSLSKYGFYSSSKTVHEIKSLAILRLER